MDADPRNSPTLACDAPTAATPRRVLVIDDHLDTAASLAVLLDAVGHDARAARSAFAAFDTLAEFDPDVCLVDLRMPMMDGFETAVRLLVILGPHVRLLAMTGEPRAAADPRTAAFERVFAKPLDVPELLRAVAESPPGGPT
jgi:two-component system, OmpR family, response regulator